MQNSVNPKVFGALDYRTGNPQNNEGRYLYPITLGDVYKMFVGDGEVDVQRLLNVLENEICTPSGRSRTAREELFTIFLAVHATQYENS
jgi:hypothetical protein